MALPVTEFSLPGDPGAGVLTGKAIVDVLLTVHTTEARRTLTHVAALSIMADAMVHTWLGDTLIDVNCTSLTYEERVMNRQSLEENAHRNQGRMCNHW